MALFRETADVSVRPATPGDENAIARTQLRAWRATHGELLGTEVLEQLDAAGVREQWAAAITSPPSPDHRVLVACDGPRVIGFAAYAPASHGTDSTDSAVAADPTAGRVATPGIEVLALEVDPDHRRAGHGSRLLTACVDLARERGATHLTTWVLDDDEGRARFLGSAGLGADGVRRELATGGPDDRTVGEHRWGAEI